MHPYISFLLIIFLLVRNVDQILLSSSRGSPYRSRRLGIDGPNISVSRIPVLMPRRARDNARLTVFNAFLLITDIVVFQQ